MNDELFSALYMKYYNSKTASANNIIQSKQSLKGSSMTLSNEFYISETLLKRASVSNLLLLSDVCHLFKDGM